MEVWVYKKTVPVTDFFSLRGFEEKLKVRKIVSQEKGNSRKKCIRFSFTVHISMFLIRLVVPTYCVCV